MRKITKKIATTEKEHNNHLNALFNEILPTYEKKCLGEYLKESRTIKKNLVFGAEQSEILEKFRQLTVKNLFFLSINCYFSIRLEREF